MKKGKERNIMCSIRKKVLSNIGSCIVVADQGDKSTYDEEFHWVHRS